MTFCRKISADFFPEKYLYFSGKIQQEIFQLTTLSIRLSSKSRPRISYQTIRPRTVKCVLEDPQGQGDVLTVCYHKTYCHCESPIIQTETDKSTYALQLILTAYSKMQSVPVHVYTVHVRLGTAANS